MEQYLIILLQWLADADFLSSGNLTDWTRVDAISDILNSTRDTYREAGAIINGFFVDLCNKQLVAFGMGMANKYTAAARYLGAIFSLCVAAHMAYKMMTEGEGIKVLKLMRPIAFAFVLANWSVICSAVMKPGLIIEGHFNGMYEQAATAVWNKQQERLQKSAEVRDIIINAKEVADIQKSDEKVKEEITKDEGFWASAKAFFSGIGDKVSDTFEAVSQSGIGRMIRGWALNLMTYVFWMLESFICGIGAIIFEVATYIVFMLKALFITVLVTFGPIYMVTSILDIWKDSWQQWIGRMVTVSLYGAMAYLVMTYSMMVIHFAIDADIDKLAQIAQNPSTGVAAYIAGGFGSSLMVVVGYLVGAIAMTSVPELATFAFPSQTVHGASGFVSGVSSYVKNKTGANKII